MNSSVEESLSVSEGLSTSAKSFIDALRAPALSDLTRKRAIHCNPLPRLRVNVEQVVRDRVNPRVSLLYSG